MRKKIAIFICLYFIFFLPVFLLKSSVIYSYLIADPGWKEISIFNYNNLDNVNIINDIDFKNNRFNSIVRNDEISLYAARVKEVSEGKFPSDPHIKENSNILTYSSDIITLCIHGFTTYLFGLNKSYFVNIFIFGFVAFYLQVVVFSKITKDKLISGIIASIAMFIHPPFNILKNYSLGDGLSFDILQILRPEMNSIRFVHITLPLIFFFLTIILFQNIDKKSSLKKSLVVFFLLNSLVYFYTWSLIVGTLIIYVIMLILHRKTIKKEFFLLTSLLITSIYTVGNLIGENQKNSIDKLKYGIYQYNLGDVFTLLFMLSLTFAAYYLLNKNKRTKFNLLLVSVLTASSLALSIDILISFPQPTHYSHYFRIMFLNIILSLAFIKLKKITEYKYCKYLYLLLYSGVIILFFIVGSYWNSFSTEDSKVRLEQNKMFNFMKNKLSEKTILTMNYYYNTMIPIHSNSYTVIPNILFSKVTINESINRFTFTGKELNLNKNILKKELIDDSKSNYRYQLVHFMKNYSLIEEIFENSYASNITFEYDYILVTPLERPYFKVNKSHDIIYIDKLHTIYKVNKK